jgi:Holliday junction resolvase RusA-like endonuclease
MIFDITPVAKPRQTQKDKWAKRPSVLKYRAFADEVRLKMGGVDLNGADVTFWMPMPKSWSKKKRYAMAGSWHTGKPDLDNLLKALMDALNKSDSDDEDRSTNERNAA